MHHKPASEAAAGAVPREEAEVGSRSCSRACSQSHPQSGSQSRWPRSPSRPPSWRRVTFREPKVEPNSEVGAEDYLPEPPISDVETWLEWQASQLSTPTWWLELRAILGVKDPWKLTHKIWASFSITEVRMSAIPGQGNTVLPTPNALTGMLPPRWLIIPGHMAATCSPDDRLCQRAAILGWKV